MYNWQLLLELTLKAMMILAAAGLLSVMLRNAAAALRHSVWSLALGGLLLLPVLTLVVPAWRVAILPAPNRYGTRSGSDLVGAPPARYRSPYCTNCVDLAMPDKAAADATAIAPPAAPPPPTAMIAPELSAEVAASVAKLAAHQDMLAALQEKAANNELSATEKQELTRVQQTVSTMQDELRAFHARHRANENLRPQTGIYWCDETSGLRQSVYPQAHANANDGRDAGICSGDETCRLGQPDCRSVDPIENARRHRRVCAVGARLGLGQIVGARSARNQNPRREARRCQRPESFGLR